MADRPFQMPSVTDDDIRQAALLLGLSEDAFHGPNGDDPRGEALKCIDSADIAACPGSGKTTVLVAKLAVLAKKWTDRTRGICVLSHTNAARYEIEKRLGNTAVGRQLLGYPHFIGTIHGFVDAFLALPWLRANGYPVKVIDTSIALSRRWGSLNHNHRSALEKNGHGPAVLQVASSDFLFGSIGWGRKKNGKRGTLKPGGETYSAMQAVCRTSIEEGYHCYDEMFVWAYKALATLPEMVKVIRDRFPLLFLDEAQDNSEAQAALLHGLYVDGDPAIRCQRFGDPDQAIYSFIEGKGAETDPFPRDGALPIPNSHRFGQKTADLAAPLSLHGHKGGLVGNGPKPICHGSTLAECSHTLFLFSDDSITQVLPSYAGLIADVFSEEELGHGVFAAMGQIHNDTGDDHFPRHVGCYWPDYDPALTKPDPQPETFIQYVRSGLGTARTSGESAQGVEKIAQAILRLAKTAINGRDIRPRRRSHRYVLELLEGDAKGKSLYRHLVDRLLVRKKRLTQQNWSRHFAERVKLVAESIAGVNLDSDEASAFLAWGSPGGLDASTCEGVNRRDNIYRWPDDDKPRVEIKLGSIHSVKGQTHTATLVLETYWYGHNMDSIKEWLMANGRTGCPSGNEKRRPKRLKLHYVAMTRPTHLLCLAMHRRTFSDTNGKLDDQAIQKLQSHGWTIKELVHAEPVQCE